MANTNKTKPTTKKVVEPKIEESKEVIEGTVKEDIPTPKKVNKPKHDPNELILCRSVRFGELRLIGPKTHLPNCKAYEF